MKSNGVWGLSAFLLVGILGVVASLRWENPLSWSECWYVTLHPASAANFDAYYFAFGTLPRLVLALTGGALLGLVGSLLQQLTQNPMTSPLTLGTSSGAWLSIILVSAFYPDLSNDYLVWCAFGGALAAFALIAAITGARNMTGVTLVISGMVVNLLFGALATAVVLLHAQFLENVFLWGAGDLEQNGWAGLWWLLPKTVPLAVLLVLFAPRALALIGLGDEGARSRGLSVVPVFLVLATAGVWLASAFITTAGVVNFTGLIAPNIARALGYKSPRRQLLASLFLGAVLLAATDSLAVWLSSLTGNIVPTGVVAAVVGTPLFILIARSQFERLTDAAGPAAPANFLVVRRRVSPAAIAGSVCALLLLLLCNLFVLNHGEGWHLGVPSVYELLVRAPRLLTSLFAGAGLAVAGVVLQRLVANPLASPDILGVSSGAALAMVIGGLYFGAAIGTFGAVWALGGSLTVLAFILGLSRRSHFSPTVVILMGIAVSAFLDSATTLSLSRGTMENYFILQWLSGSTYHASLSGSVVLAVSTVVLIAAALFGSRSLTLLSVSRDFAASRGLPLGRASLLLLGLCALLCALATASMGPVAFVGLVAPHMALLLGARTAAREIVTAALLGSVLVAGADWCGQTLIAPAQIPAGTLAAILGAGYFLLLLLASRLRRRREA